MDAEQLFRAGQVDEAVAQLNEDLRALPTDDGRRSFLVELLCLNGQWDRAARVLGGMQDPQGPRTSVYQRLLRAEAKRRAFLRGEGTPRFLGEARADLDLGPYQEAARALERGEDSTALDLLEEAETRRPRVAGQRGGVAFPDLRDADDRFAPVLEVLDGEDYAWVPFLVLRSLQVQPPRHPFDFVFAPVLLDAGTGPRPVFVPTRYPGSECSSVPAVRLARQTTTLEGALTRCQGQRVLLLGESIVPFLQLESLVIGQVSSVTNAEVG